MNNCVNSVFIQKTKNKRMKKNSKNIKYINDHLENNCYFSYAALKFGLIAMVKSFYDRSFNQKRFIGKSVFSKSILGKNVH